MGVNIQDFLQDFFFFLHMNSSIFGHFTVIHPPISLKNDGGLKRNPKLKVKFKVGSTDEMIGKVLIALTLVFSVERSNAASLSAVETESDEFAPHDSHEVINLI